MKTLSRISLALVIVTFAQPSLAYVGPGAGLSVLGALWGLILALLAAFGFLLMWPLRRYRRQRAQASATAPREHTAERTAGDDADSPGERR